MLTRLLSALALSLACLLSSAAYATVTATITSPTVLPINEGASAFLTITLDQVAHAGGVPVVLDFPVVTAPASRADDYQVLQGGIALAASGPITVTVPAGATTLILEVRTVDDAFSEGEEFISIALQTVDGVAVVPALDTHVDLSIDANDNAVSAGLNVSVTRESVNNDTATTGWLSLWVHAAPNKLIRSAVFTLPGGRQVAADVEVDGLSAYADSSNVFNGRFQVSLAELQSALPDGDYQVDIVYTDNTVETRTESGVVFDWQNWPAYPAVTSPLHLAANVPTNAAGHVTVNWSDGPLNDVALVAVNGPVTNTARDGFIGTTLGAASYEIPAQIMPDQPYQLCLQRYSGHMFSKICTVFSSGTASTFPTFSASSDNLTSTVIGNINNGVYSMRHKAADNVISNFTRIVTREVVTQPGTALDVATVKVHEVWDDDSTTSWYAQDVAHNLYLVRYAENGVEDAMVIPELMVPVGATAGSSWYGWDLYSLVSLSNTAPNALRSSAVKIDMGWETVWFQPGFGPVEFQPAADYVDDGIDYLPLNLDTDNDGVIDTLDTDDDNDGIVDTADSEPLAANKFDPKLVGVWTVDRTNTPVAGHTSRVVLRIDVDGNYIMQQADMTAAANNLPYGAELGQITAWNPATGQITLRPFDGGMYVDYNGTRGLSNPIAVGSGGYGYFTLTMSGTQLKLAEGAAANLQYTFNRVTESAGTPIGAWSAGYGIFTPQVVFFPDNKYLLMYAHGNPMCVPAGGEWGTWAYNSGTHVMTPTITNANYNTDGCGGLVDGFNPTITLDFSNDVVAIDNSRGGGTFNRVYPGLKLHSRFVGVWTGSDGVVLRIDGDGNYIMGQGMPTGFDGVPGQSGIERGRITAWNAVTGIVTITKMQNTNGDWGLLEDAQPTSTHVFQWLNNQLIIDNDAVHSLAEQQAGTIIGTWVLPPDGQHITFFADGTFFMMDPVGDTDVSSCGGPGIERGTYTYDTTTHELITFPMDAGEFPTVPEFDSNGCAGLLDDGVGTSYTVDVVGNMLQIDAGAMLFKVNTDDADGDGVSDVFDAFPYDPAETLDTDHDGIGNNADLDDDADGVPDVSDAFPLNAAESVDTDNDGIGNNADWDDDDDGVPDAVDANPLNASITSEIILPLDGTHKGAHIGSGIQVL